MSKPTSLQDYIATKGDVECAAAWGFKPRSVAAWRRGERTPDVESARVILLHASGELSWESIYGPAPVAEAGDQAA